MRRYLLPLLVLSLICAAVAVRVLPAITAEECTAENWAACE